jgi:hypothetical protein
VHHTKRLALITAAGLALGGLATSGAYAASVSESAKTACMVAVNANYGGQVDDLTIVHTEFSQANSEVIVDASGIRGGSGKERWRCLVSNDGEVQDLSVVE